MSMVGNKMIFSNNPSFTGTGNGATSAYTLSWSPPTANAVEVTLGGIHQVPNTDYTVSGTTLTFTSSVPNGVAIFAVGLTVSGSSTIPSAASVVDGSFASSVTGTGSIVRSISPTITGDLIAPGFPRKNFVINGNMEIAQRGTTAVTTNAAYGPCDRWQVQVAGSTFSATQGSFVSGDALFDPTAGNTAAQYFTAVAVTSVAGAANYAILYQPIENVRLIAGKTVSVSFWAKAAAGTPSIGVECSQVFGTGGSTQVTNTGVAVALSTTWTKYTVQQTMGSLNGKTLGTDNTSISQLFFWLDAGANWNIRSGSIGQASKTVSIAQVQVEIGSSATEFEVRPKQQELALCQRYYAESGTGDATTLISFIATGASQSMFAMYFYKVPMRISPTNTIVGTWGVANSSQPSFNAGNTTHIQLYITSAAAGSGYAYNNLAGNKITFSAEL